MAKKYLASITHLFTTAFFLSITTNTLSADQKIISDDGREILLNENGSWIFRSTDRFASTKEGHRIRLKEDGSWTYAGNAPLKSKTQVRTAELGIKLQKVIVEKYKKKSQKNTQLKTQTIFYVELNLSAQAKKNINIKSSDTSFIEVKDNSGKNYPVLSINADIAELKPNTHTTIIIRAEKSPTIFSDAKSMAITFKVGIFGINTPISLSQKIDDFEEKNVRGFE